MSEYPSSWQVVKRSQKTSVEWALSLEERLRQRLRPVRMEMTSVQVVVVEVSKRSSWVKGKKPQQTS